MAKELNAKVLDRFGLRRDPFENADAYSPVGKRHEILEQMVHLSQFSNLVIAVISPAGFGKSVLYKMLGKQLSSEKDLIVTQFRLISRVSGMSLLQRLSEAWKLDAPSVNRETLLRQLRNDQLKRSTVGIRHCILIDNAEFIDPDGLQMLHALTTGLPEDRSIGLALFCHESVVDLRSIFKPSESLHLIRLQVLTQRDVYAFIKDHFRMAGAKKGVPITPEAMENIAVDSEGIPAKVIALTREYMVAQSGMPIERMGIQLTKPQRLGIAIIGGAIILGGISFLVQSLFFTSTTIKPAKVESVSLPAPTPKLTDPQVTAAVTAPVAPEVVVVPKVIDAPSTSVPIESKPAPVPEIAPTPVKTIAIEPPVPPTPIAPTPVAPTPIAPTPAAAATVTTQAPEPTPVTKPIVATKAGKTTAAVSRPWFINAAPGAYTIQILGSHQEVAVQAYIDGQSNPGDFDYVRSSLNGDAWYVVLYKVFDTKDQAVKLIPTLPDSIKAKQPWVRSVGSIRPDNG
jgi:DamX protein